jgi:hypothetical protein
LVEAEQLQGRKRFGITAQLDRGAFASGHQAPGSEIGQHVHRWDVGEGEEDRVAIGMQRIAGPKGGNGLMDGGVNGEGDDGHISS